MSDELEKFIEEYISQNEGQVPTVQELNVFASRLNERKKNSKFSTFEGYSPQEIHAIMLSPWSILSPLKLNILEEADFENIPLLRQIRHLIATLQREGKIKLTAKGNIPLKIVKELYAIGASDEYIDEGIIRITSEDASISVRLTHILVKIMKIIKDQKGVMTLTKAGEKIANDPQRVLEELLFAFCCKFDLSFFDLYPYEEIGRLGMGFNFILLGKYGSKKRLDKFYRDKYFEEFPDILEDSVFSFGGMERETQHCYSLRVFRRFMYFLGLVNIECECRITAPTYISKTPLFDKMITILPPE